MAAEALTAKRRAACRIVLPPSTTRTIRSRRSWDKGAVMINSTALTPSTLEAEHLIPCKPEPLERQNLKSHFLSFRALDLVAARFIGLVGHRSSGERGSGPIRPTVALPKPRGSNFAPTPHESPPRDPGPARTNTPMRHSGSSTSRLHFRHAVWTSLRRIVNSHSGPVLMQRRAPLRQGLAQALFIGGWRVRVSGPWRRVRPGSYASSRPG